jgi:polyhydroxybutyrate depolymerase
MSRLLVIVFVLFCGSVKSAYCQRDILDSVFVDGRMRTFTVHIPAGISPDQVVPAVVLLHGAGRTMTDMVSFTEMNTVSDAEKFIVVYPQAITPLFSGYVWADGRNTEADQAGVNDVLFLSSLVDSLVERYNVDDSRCYLGGYSNGGFMAVRMACEASGRYAAIGMVGASMDVDLFVSCKPLFPTAVIAFFGTFDPGVPYDGGPMPNPESKHIVAFDSLANKWSAINRCSTAGSFEYLDDVNLEDESIVVQRSFTDCACSTSVRQVIIDGGGHTWPGVPVPDEMSYLGAVNMDMNASVEMWSFFRQFSRCDVQTSVDTDKNFHPKSRSPIISMVYHRGTVESTAILERAIRVWTIVGEEVSAQAMTAMPDGLYFVHLQD